jgi:hypothetical protein
MSIEQPDQIYADAFGGPYPVCTQGQKERLEAAYKKMMEYLATTDHPGRTKQKGCDCELLISLMESPDRDDLIAAAVVLSEIIYAQKTAMSALRASLLDMVAQQGGIN